ncbi:MAG: MBL fold metallo-hydrolase [Ignavibacteriae bacterium HGW-Ignavibacteriae-4]|jgi:ribonuclease BN (tRNA processing enzyme)|nr:MAG: MBL fold metallo-hydrolase [Ignavibacteriae bacterium HGW-Ignavibacteriae-4]
MKKLKIEDTLSLKNDGKLEIVFIGSGTAFSETLGNNNIIIIKGDTHILVDFGLTAPFALKPVTGLDILDIENVLPTHSHSDHIGGLEYLTLKNRYFGQPKGKPRLTMIIPDEYRTVLWEESLKGGLRYNELGKYENEMTFESYFDYVTPNITHENGRIKHHINFKGIDLEFFHTNHIPGQAVKTEDAFITYGLLIDGKVFFSGDTKFDDELIAEYEHKADYLFHDCSFFPNPVHADIDSLRTLSEELRKRIVLMHYGDDYENHDYSDFHSLAEPGVRYIFD